MTTSDPQSAFVWTWLPGADEPVVAGRIDVDGPMHLFTYARSYRERADAVSLYEPELPLVAGTQRPPGRATIAGCLRDSGPDSWGQRVILTQHLGHLTGASDVGELSLLTYLLESGSDRIGALDFQASASEYVPRTASSATLEQLMAAAAGHRETACR
jgi:serine/threonine-protein kinase HipA